MNINSKDYIKALTIEERNKIINESNNNSYINFEKYNEWINIRGVVREQDIINYFETKNITPEQIAKVIDITNEDDKNILASHVEKSKWFRDFVDVMFEYKKKRREVEDKEVQIDFGTFVLPFVLYAGDKLNEKIKGVTNISINSDVLQNMLEKITGVLVNLGIKTFVWEFRKNTYDGDVNDLGGDENKNVLLKEYLAKLSNEEEFLLLYSKYPVIMRRIVTKTSQLIHNFSLLIDRVEKDYDEIREIVGNHISTWEGIDADQGDTHENGNFVVKLTFDGGKIIYKPRNLKIQDKFYQFIETIAQKDDAILDMMSCKSKYHNEYKWDGFVEYIECKSLEEVQRFYRRFGQLCAFVYILRGNDIHYENIIAKGEYPIIIDVETLFQHLSDSVYHHDNASSIVYKDSIDSVGGTAMVPIVAFSKGETGKGIDISALGGGEQELPYKVLQLVGVNTDKIRFEEKNAKMGAANNIPIYQGKEVDFKEYIDEIIKGFENVMKFVANNNDEFLDDNFGWINIFKDIKERHLMRATQNYAKMMAFTSHPNYNEDIIMMERMLINVWSYPYNNKSIIKYEVEDMIFGDIPIFYGITNSRDIYSSNNVVENNYFMKSAFTKVQERIKGITKEEIEKQVSQMKICMGTYITENSKKNNVVNYDVEVNESEIMKKVEYIIDEIFNNAVIHRESNTIEWNNVIFDNINMCWKSRGVGCGLINGSAGILPVVYLANKYINKYDAHIKTMINSIVNMPNDKLPIVLSDGIAANLYSMLVIYKDSLDEGIKGIIYYLLNVIASNINTCNSNSFMYGLSGVALVVAEAWKLLKDDSVKMILDAIIVKITTSNEAFKDDSLYSGTEGCVYCLKYIMSLGYSSYTNEIQTYVEKIRCDKQNVGYSYELLSEEMNMILEAKSEKEKFISFSNGKSEELFNAIKSGETANINQILKQVMSGVNSEDKYFPAIEGYVTVGFMYGLSGIGYTLLKYCHPEICDIPLVNID